ncbi:MAG: helix-turn-helix domain-containing protein [Halobacterium sp.]
MSERDSDDDELPDDEPSGIDARDDAPADDEHPDDGRVGGDVAEADADFTEDDVGASSARERLEAEADRAVSEFDESVVDLLAWLLDTETRARIYVYLRQHPASTSDEVADGTGLYPSTVREALAQLHEEETVTRSKRASAGAGNNPYEYEAIAPSNLVRNAVGQVQSQLNTVFNLDRRLGDDEGDDQEPVRITVEDADDT